MNFSVFSEETSVKIKDISESLNQEIMVIQVWTCCQFEILAILNDQFLLKKH